MSHVENLIDHDRLFKELLTTFFSEFVELFIPDLAAFMDRQSVDFLDKEVFTDITLSERHEVDLLARARVAGTGDVFFLIHVENQASARPEFARRMFRYFARLHEKHDLPIFPVVIFSYDQPLRQEPDRYVVDFPNKRVLEFAFTAIQLNRLSWRDYLRNPNPVASALMAKMQVAPQDRPRVKLECLRMLATLKMDRARSTLIATFMDTYLQLTAAELSVYNRAVEMIEPHEREAVMIWTNEWMEMGRAVGLQDGSRKTILRQLRRRIEALPDRAVDHINQLNEQQLDELTDATLDLQTLTDLEKWLAAHPPVSTLT